MRRFSPPSSIFSFSFPAFMRWFSKGKPKTELCRGARYLRLWRSFFFSLKKKQFIFIFCFAFSICFYHKAFLLRLVCLSFLRPALFCLYHFFLSHLILCLCFLLPLLADGNSGKEAELFRGARDDFLEFRQFLRRECQKTVSPESRKISVIVLTIRLCASSTSFKVDRS